ncbi:MAG: AIM24 family protein [Chloroflexaceae bacterium]|nr:AIM24 family protein [Chloroflexaceae bacterium]
MPAYQLRNDRLLAVSIGNEKVNALAGSMVAYEGSVKFEKSILRGEGLFGSLKRKMTGEGFPLMVANGTGTVYFAHQAREITIIELRGDKLLVEGSRLLVYDPSLKTGTKFTGLRGATSGQGLFTTTLEGNGQVAVISDGNLIKLRVTPAYPLHVDPDAYIGHQGNLKQDFTFDINWKTLTGMSSGESYQLKFSGDGVVYIQPSER